MRDIDGLAADDSRAVHHGAHPHHSNRRRWRGTATRAAACLLAVVGAAAATPHEPPAVPPETAALIDALGQKDENAAIEAAKALSSMGPAIVPTLVDTLRNRRGCQMQWVASAVLRRIDAAHPLVDATLLAITKGECDGDWSPNVIVFRRQAAFALVSDPEWTPTIAQMLTGPDDFVRRSAAFAFDDVTERLEGRPPELQPTPAILAAVAAALPPLRDAALHDNDDIVRCVSYESLGQASRSKHKALREPARKLMKGQRFRCK
ncbi:MAG: hypothetical protein JNM38_20995 [Acidobacteria bacterium]|nr:hypothetical protein [Acidobacteriota bacterium]